MKWSERERESNCLHRRDINWNNQKAKSIPLQLSFSRASCLVRSLRVFTSRRREGRWDKGEATRYITLNTTSSYSYILPDRSSTERQRLLHVVATEAEQNSSNLSAPSSLPVPPCLGPEWICNIQSLYDYLLCSSFLVYTVRGVLRDVCMAHLSRSPFVSHKGGGDEGVVSCVPLLLLTSGKSRLIVLVFLLFPSCCCCCLSVGLCQWGFNHFIRCCHRRRRRWAADNGPLLFARLFETGDAGPVVSYHYYIIALSDRCRCFIIIGRSSLASRIDTRWWW